jgi:tRNA (guanine37-N1)-methyltransferase
MKLLKAAVNAFRVISVEYSSRVMNLVPPKVVCLTALDREKFNKTVRVPTITITDEVIPSMSHIVKHLKKYLVRVEKFHPVQKGKIFLSPDVVNSWEDLPTETLAEWKIDSSNFKYEDVEFTYQNWKADELVKAIIPEGLEPVTSFSKVGHIIHMNIKDELLPYKSAIAQIFLDKTPGCRTVINKAKTIDNTYRNFQIDLLAGEAEYQTVTKENGIAFEFDFSAVYWNSRLSTEHERLVKLLNPKDYLYDVFAGVGPFAVPAGKKRVTVLANDLNPNSFKWLEVNVKKNKVQQQVTTFNKDGRDFILEEVKQNLLERIEKRGQEGDNYSIHLAMNLPALAVTFLNAFVGLLKGNEKGFEDSNSIPTPICHCYCFVKGVDDPKVMARELAEENLGFKLVPGETLKDISFVRNVAPNKDMMRVDILLTSDILFDTINAKRSADDSTDLLPSKKQCN